MATLNEIFEGIVAPEYGNFSAELAQYVLGLKFSDEQIARYETLADRNQSGSLTPEEKAELEGYVIANDFLTVLKLKARQSMLQQSPAA